MQSFQFIQTNTDKLSISSNQIEPLASFRSTIVATNVTSLPLILEGANHKAETLVLTSLLVWTIDIGSH